MGSDSELSREDNPVFRPGWHARPLLIIGTVLALAAGPTILLDQMWPDLPWGLLFLFQSLTGTQSVLLTLWSLKPENRGEAQRVLIADVVLSVFILRIYTWLITGTFPDKEGWFDILRAPGLVFDPFFVIAVVLVGFAFFRAAGLTRMFYQLSLDRTELPVVDSAAPARSQRGDMTPLFSDRQRILERYYRDWAIGGGFLILCAALSTIDFASIEPGTTWFRSFRSIIRLGLKPEMFAALLVYFLGGFLLASEGRLAMLNARWTYDGVKVDWQLNSSWRRFTLLIILVMALLAAFIPIGSAVDLSGVFQAVGWIAIFLLGAIVAVFAAVYWLLYTLLVVIRPGDEQVELSFDEIVPDIPQVVSQPSELTSIILGSLVWITIITAVILAVIYLTRNHDLRIRKRRVLEWWRRFVLWLRSQFQRATGGIIEAAREVRRTLSSIEPPLAGRTAPWRFIRLNSLSARDKIRYFYLSTVRRAKERGVPRANAATPLEYTRDLQEVWPEISDDFEALTQAFIKARYSSRPIEEPEAQAVKPFWKRIGRALRRRGTRLET